MQTRDQSLFDLAVKFMGVYKNELRSFTQVFLCINQYQYKLTIVFLTDNLRVLSNQTKFYCET